MIHIINKLKDTFENIDKKNLNIMKNGLKFCFGILMLSISILLTYLIFVKHIFVYQLGLLVFELSLYFAIDFIVAGVVVDTIRKQIM